MEAIASPSGRPGLVKEFLDGWYAGSRNVYWHGNHRDDDSGYMGYWAFEAALVVMLFDIDDSSFRDHEYYPADLVAHYRRRADPAATAGHRHCADGRTGGHEALGGAPQIIIQAGIAAGAAVAAAGRGRATGGTGRRAAAAGLRDRRLDLAQRPAAQLAA
ncbi:hypothetical protein G6F31_017268 [Rhizopus arrhizus]|nr:hypothetical protein G6F31_017268 [Rhizopus arrhizus]